MRRLIACFIMIIPAFPALVVHADNPIACVHPDIANTLLGMPGQGKVEIARTIYEGFPEVGLPTTFELIGSRNAQYFSMVAFKTNSAVDEARASLKGIMTNAEWQFPELNIPAIQGGFQSTQMQPIRSALSMCHDSLGHLTAMFSDRPDGGTYITLMASPRATPSRCELMKRLPYGLRIPSMPILRLPSDAKSRQTGGNSSSGDSASTRIQLETSLVASELLAFLNEQLSEQGWLQEGSWGGVVVSGSAWISGEEKQSGILSVIDQGDSQFKLVFQTTNREKVSAPSVSFGANAIQGKRQVLTGRRSP